MLHFFLRKGNKENERNGCGRTRPHNIFVFFWIEKLQHTEQMCTTSTSDMHLQGSKKQQKSWEDRQIHCHKRREKMGKDQTVGHLKNLPRVHHFMELNTFFTATASRWEGKCLNFQLVKNTFVWEEYWPVVFYMKTDASLINFLLPELSGWYWFLEPCHFLFFKLGIESRLSWIMRQLLMFKSDMFLKLSFLLWPSATKILTGDTFLLFGVFDEFKTPLNVTFFRIIIQMLHKTLNLQKDNQQKQQWEDSSHLSSENLRCTANLLNDSELFMLLGWQLQWILVFMSS